MCDYNDVTNLLEKTVINSKGKITNEVLNISGLSFLKLRDVLYTVGKIITENIAEQTYIATIQSGFLKMTSVVLAVQLLDNKLMIAAYSMGIINRKKVCKGAINELRKGLVKFVR